MPKKREETMELLPGSTSYILGGPSKPLSLYRMTIQAPTMVEDSHSPTHQSEGRGVQVEIPSNEQKRWRDQLETGHTTT